MSRRVLISQSNYIPWKGYFENIARSDVFVVYDDVQFTRRDWRNRNLIKTATGPAWLTVPVEVKGRFHQAIDATRIDGTEWKENHLERIRHAYAKAPHFKEVFPWIASLYREAPGTMLSELNVFLLRAVCDALGIRTEFMHSRSFELVDDRSERLVQICKALGADEYFTGPSARNYMDTSLFEREDIQVVYADYADYPEYPQLHPPFDHAVCIWDVLLNCGDAARDMVLRRSARTP